MCDESSGALVNAAAPLGELASMRDDDTAPLDGAAAPLDGAPCVSMSVSKKDGWPATELLIRSSFAFFFLHHSKLFQLLT